MIARLIGRPGDKLRGLLRAASVVGAATLTLLAGAMALSSAPALAAGPPEVVAEGVGWTATFEAHVEAIINPDEQLTQCHIQYGTTSVTEHEVPCEPPSFEGSEEPLGSANLSGLHESSKYHYRFVLKNSLNEEADGAEEEFETAVAEPPSVIAEGPGPVKQRQATVEAIVDGDNQVTECFVHYGKTSITEHEAPCSTAKLEGPFEPVGVTGNPTGLEPQTKYHYEFSLKNELGEEATGAEEEFETLAVPSEVETGEAETITATSAVINGNKLNAGGEATYYIEYGPEPCGATTCGESTHEEGSGTTTQEEVASFALTQLRPDTTYHYWLVAKNEGVTVPVHGEAKSFTTPLTVPTEIETGGTEEITTTSASLEGELNPGGEATYYFEYGTEPCSTTCGQKTAEAVAFGSEQESVTPVGISGLTPGTIYHYWIVVKNSIHPAGQHGEAGVFRTAETAAEEQAEAKARTGPEEERAMVLAARAKAAEELARQEQATNAAAAATHKQYEEINAVTASSERQAAELKHTEEVIADTAVTITKVKVKSSGVAVTIHATQAGTVTIAGADLKSKTVKVAAGTRTVTLSFTAAGKKARKNHKKTKLSVSLVTSLTEASASSTVKL